MLDKILLLAILLAPVLSKDKFPMPSSPRPNPNKVIEIDTLCNKETFDIKLMLERPFKGIVFTKDFSRECKTQGNKEKKIAISLPSNACGVRTSSQLNSSTELSQADEDGLHYSVTLVVQMERYLQQSSDQELVVKCWLRPRSMRIQSDAVEEMIKKKITEMTKKEAKKRTGRTRQDWVESMSAEQREWLLEQARAWMELVPATPAAQQDLVAVEVGEPTKLLIKSTLPVGVGLRITNCLAHDGLGEASQNLLDEYGCPIDEIIFSKPSIVKHKAKKGEANVADLEPASSQNVEHSKHLHSDPESLYKNIMVYQHAITTFGAFKFPDRARLHLTCGIELCKGECPEIDCKTLQKPQKTKDGLLRRARLDKDANGVVIDRLEVYNSIEVLAPNIELQDEASIRGSRQHDLDEFARGFSPGDKTVCLSPSKMAFAFCFLGLIFLGALVVAFVSLIRARRKFSHDRLNTSLSFYTGSKSLFSTSNSSSSGLSGSKLLLTDSPFLDQQSSSSNNWPYARVF